MVTAVAYSSCDSLSAQLHPGQVSLLQFHRERQTTLHTLTLTQNGHFRAPSLPHMHVLLYCGKTAECPVGTHARQHGGA